MNIHTLTFTKLSLHTMLNTIGDHYNKHALVYKKSLIIFKERW